MASVTSLELPLKLAAFGSNESMDEDWRPSLIIEPASFRLLFWIGGEWPCDFELDLDDVAELSCRFSPFVPAIVLQLDSTSLIRPSWHTAWSPESGGDEAKVLFFLTETDAPALLRLHANLLELLPDRWPNESLSLDQLAAQAGHLEPDVMDNAGLPAPPDLSHAEASTAGSPPSGGGSTSVSSSSSDRENEPSSSSSTVMRTLVRAATMQSRALSSIMAATTDIVTSMDRTTARIDSLEAQVSDLSSQNRELSQLLMKRVVSSGSAGVKLAQRTGINGSAPPPSLATLPAEILQFILPNPKYIDGLKLDPSLLDDRKPHWMPLRQSWSHLSVWPSGNDIKEVSSTLRSVSQTSRRLRAFVLPLLWSPCASSCLLNPHQ